MARKKDETASFVLRFTQKITVDETKASKLQWRGTIRHVQSGDEKRFVDLKTAIDFMQAELASLTMQQVTEKSPEEQKGLLAQSLDFWKRVSANYPKIVMETIKDPKAGVEQLQEEVNQQITQVKDSLSARLDPDAWTPATKTDVQELSDLVLKLATEVRTLQKKVDKLA